MSRLVPIQFGTQLAEHKSGPLSQELAQNVFLEQAPRGAKSPTILLGSPGLTLHASVGDGPIRGLLHMKGEVFAVSGETLYRITQAGATYAIGTVPGTGPVSMAHNDQTSPGPYLWVATGKELYAANRTVIQTVANGYGISDVVYQDGYLIGVVANSQDMFISATDNALSVSAADYTTVDAFEGILLGVTSDHREVYALKEDSIECYYNSGDPSFPFTRSQVIERGVRSGLSAAKIQGAIFLLGDDLQVYRVVGYQPQVISTPSIAQIIAERNSPQTAFGYTYQQEGHTFYSLNFADKTLIYDVTTGLWHTRKSDGLDVHRVRAHTYARRWNKQVVGDIENGNIYTLEPEVYSDNGATIQRRMVGTPIWQNGNRFIVDEFYLDIEGGVGLVSGQGSDPQAILEWSNDGGVTWGTEVWRGFGQIGERYIRAKWRSLGAHYNWIPRITITDPVPIRISGAYARITALQA